LKRQFLNAVVCPLLRVLDFFQPIEPVATAFLLFYLCSVCTTTKEFSLPSFFVLGTNTRKSLTTNARRSRGPGPTTGPFASDSPARPATKKQKVANVTYEEPAENYD